MSQWTSDLIILQREANRVFGVEFTINAGSTRYQGTQKDTTELLPLMAGGFPHDYDGAIDFIQSDVAALIQGDKITVYEKGAASGTQYRVESFIDSPECPLRTALLIGVNK